MSETDSKEKIIHAAKKIFATKGFDGTSTREIVAEAGVNISLISYYFKSKESLFFALFDRFLASPDAVIAESNQYSIEEFCGIIARIIKLRFDDPDLVTILQQELILCSKRSGKFRDILAPIWNRMKAILDYQMKQGVFLIKDADSALSFVMAVVGFPRQHFLYQAYIQKKEDPQYVTDETISFILRGLGYIQRT